MGNVDLSNQSFSSVPTSYVAKTLTLDITCNCLPNSVISAMLTSAISFQYVIQLSVTLTLAGDHKVSFTFLRTFQLK